MLLLTACGALAPEGNPVGVLPSSGAGPYRALDEPSPLLQDRSGSLDDPFLVADAAGPGFTVYVTRRADDGAVGIARARFPGIEAAASGPEPTLEPVLAADAAWEGGGVLSPSLFALEGGRALLLFATASGRLGCALSDGNGRFVKVAGPAREPATGQGPLGSPALLALPEGRARLLFVDGDPGGGGGEGARLAAVDLDARGVAALGAGEVAALHDGAAAELPREGALSGLGRFTARTVLLATGRRRFDLFLTRIVLASPRSLAFAASFDGVHFSAAPAPLLPAAAPEEWAPAALAAPDGGTLLLYVGALGRRGVVLAARAP